MSILGLCVLPLLLLLLRQSVLVILISVAVYIHMIWGAGVLEYFIQDIWSSINKEVILAVPLFILVGQVMSRGSIARRLIRVMEELTRPLPGGLGVATVLSCAVFSAISGSSIVTLMAMGTVMYPALLERGYRKSFAIGTLAAGGTLGMVIPPSVPMIIYGVVTETSISDLFLAGIGPGLLIAGVFSLYAILMHRDFPPERWRPGAIWAAFKSGIWALLLPVILLGGIYSGYFSPTEAAAVALFYALLVEVLVHRELSPAGLWSVTLEAGKLVGILFPLIAVAMSLNLLATENRVPQMLIDWVLSSGTDSVSFIIVVNLMLLALGCVMDPMSAILILAPILAPMAETFGYDRTLFGVIMILNLEIGFLTPPMGLNLIIAMTVFHERFGTVCRSALPFVALLMLCLTLVILFPVIAMAPIS